MSWGGDPYISKIIVPIVIFFVSIIAFGFLSIEATQDACKSDTNDKISGWLQKMQLSATADFEDSFLVNGRCVEYIDHTGIKYNDEDKVRVIQISADEKLSFEFVGVEKITPREALYRVRIQPSTKSVSFIEFT